MGEKGEWNAWPWGEVGLAWVVWWTACRLGNGEQLGNLVAPAPLFLTVGIALIVATGLRVPLCASKADVAKTETIRRVTTTVLTTAVAAALADALGFVGLSATSIVLASIVTWLALAIATSLRPLPSTLPDEEAATMSWLPVPTTSLVAIRAKRVFDVTGALLLLALSSPVLVVVALAIKAHDGGPVFFRQTRTGRLGQHFEMIKFRSMGTDAEARRGELENQNERNGPLFKMTNDPRITPVGRLIRELSIDELPQLVNIVRGQMSLVGPRPALPDEFQKFDHALRRRVLVTPGLTGLWQAEARNDTSFARFRELDLRYVSTASPALDMWILLATAIEVLVAAVRLPLRVLGASVGQTDGINLRDVVSVPNIIDLRDTGGGLDAGGTSGDGGQQMHRPIGPSSASI